MTLSESPMWNDTRNQWNHPVIDCDGHCIEFEPAFLDILAQVGGREICRRYLLRRKNGARMRWYRMSWDERRAWRAIRPPWWRVPTINTLDYATFMLPQLRYQRMEAMGIDYTVLYPTYGLSYPHIPEDDLRQACCRAENIMQSEIYKEFSDRIAPAAIIPMHTPQEAIEELEFACGNLKMNCVMLAGHVIRSISGIEKQRYESSLFATWIDTLGLDSEYNYDPVWEKCVELKVSPTFHSAGIGWGSRISISNYVYNHISHFATAGEAICKSLILGGVLKRFPDLNFAFLEGGVAWACCLFSELINHWEKRNGSVVKNYDPANIDIEQLYHLFNHFGGHPSFRKWSDLLNKGNSSIELGKDKLADTDDWEVSGIQSLDDIREIFTDRMFFGCEADDPMNALAFNTALNPLNIRFNAIFGSDIGHWDVQDITGVVNVAFEHCSKHKSGINDFRDLVFNNPVTFLTKANADFFKGSIIERG